MLTISMSNWIHIHVGNTLTYSEHQHVYQINNVNVLISVGNI